MAILIDEGPALGTVFDAIMVNRLVVDLHLPSGEVFLL